jgi:hypothetical protein
MFSHLGQASLKLAGAAIIAAAGAGLIVGLPAFSSNSASDASVRASAQAVAGATRVDAATCDRQSWPYLDQRCLDPAANGKDLRQVRVISLDRGAPTTIVTTAAPSARVTPQNSAPATALAAPQSRQNSGTVQIAWAAYAPQLALLAQSNVAGQTKAPTQTTTRVAMAPLAGQARQAR